MLRAVLFRVAQRTITAAHLQQRNPKLVRASGIAYDYEASHAGLVCAASPITAAHGAVAGALSPNRPGRSHRRARSLPRPHVGHPLTVEPGEAFSVRE